MRIIHCLRAPVGGLFRHVLDLAGAQAALGHDVGLVVGRDASDALTEAKFAAIAPQLTLGIKRIAMPRFPAPTDVLAVRSVLAHARGLKLDVLHGHGAKGGAYARLAGHAIKSGGQPVGVFYTPHGGTLHFRPGSLEGILYLTLERRLDQLTDGLIFESGFAARVYAGRMGAGRAARRIVHNGLKPQDFVPAQPAPGAADLLFIGELRELKGVDVLLAALAHLNAGRPRPLTAVIAGSGPDGARFKRQAHELGLDRVVTFCGAMPAAQAMALGRIMVVPSRKESLPYVVLEAAAAGLPVIATDAGGIPEIVAGTDTALVPAGDAAALAAAIQMVTGDTNLAHAQAQRLKAAVAGRFTLARMTASILDFYADPHGTNAGHS